ncbi:MAG: TAXI family TRAP transporter solute-binding subunit [Rhodopila sp.]|nr:TAXI family TRAP transporter solute-binding subunit [Rhodopila sp.]
MKLLAIVLTVILGVLGPVSAPLGMAVAQTGGEPPEPQTSSGPTAPQSAAVARRAVEMHEIEKLNAWTVGLAAGQLEGAPIRFATDIARVVDDGDNLHVLPIVTRGPTENVEALLYLRGVDVAIINSDALEQFKSLVPNIQKRITYILNLFPSELHVFVRPEIKSLSDLKGKKVNFNTPGTTAAYSGPLIFDQMKLDVEKTFIPHQVALEQMKKGQGDMAAVVFITSKPVDAFLRGKWDPGFKFLPVPLGNSELYLPSTLTASDYPQLIPQGEEVQTIAIPTILAAFNWQKGSDRYKRVARLTDYLFDRLDRLQGPGFHPKWKDVNLAAKVPGLDRFPEAQEWLDKTAASRVAAAPPGVVNTAGSAPPGTIVLPATPEEQRLYQEFLDWRRRRGK